MTKNDDAKKKLGERIRFFRKQRNITQEAFAEKINIEPQSLSNIERGKYAPSFETIQKISEVLGIEIYQLYLFEGFSSWELMKSELIEAIISNDTFAIELYNYYKNSKISKLFLK